VAFADARASITEAIAAHVSPAAVIEVGRASRPIWQEAFGHLTYDAGAAPASRETIFDLASLTKVIATASLAMRAVNAGRLSLETRVAEILSEWDTSERRDMRIRHLLDHSSGLPGVARIWEYAAGRDKFERAIRALPLESAPGTRSVYSDPGFILLGFLLEQIAAEPLDIQFDLLAESWGATLDFLPAAVLRDRIAPTEFDERLGRLHHGDVHDENAAALGGVAGHAGLFGTVTDVGAFARAVMRTFTQKTELGTPDLMRVFASPTGVPDSSRALGWDTMRPTSSCGTLMSLTAIGHTGFTGTSLWIDHEKDVYVVLLMNRVHPTRTNEGHITLRPRVHDAVMREVLSSKF